MRGGYLIGISSLETDTRCGIVARRGMASFKVKFPVLQELFAKNHRGPFAPPPPPAGRGLTRVPLGYFYNTGAFSSPSDLRNFWTDSQNSRGPGKLLRENKIL